MKFFKKNKAVTLVELVISMTISVILFLIVFVFISDGMDELSYNTLKVWSIDESFEFKDTVSRIIRWWYNDIEVLTWNTNHVLYLKNNDLTSWVLIWVVNLNSKKIQQLYQYWDNYFWYRYLSESEISEIDLDNSKVYDKIFHDDKIFSLTIAKDFQVNFYNWQSIIDIYYSFILLKNESSYGTDFSDFFIDKENIMEYNLVF